MDQTPPRQLILPTDNRNPCFSLYVDEDENIHVYYGLELLEVVPNDPGHSAYKLLAGRLYNGRVKVAVYNHATFDQREMGARGRGVLNVAIGQDGVHWQGALVLDYLNHPYRQFSYPAVIQSQDGLNHVV